MTPSNFPDKAVNCVPQILRIWGKRFLKTRAGIKPAPTVLFGITVMVLNMPMKNDIYVSSLGFDRKKGGADIMNPRQGKVLIG